MEVPHAIPDTTPVAEPIDATDRSLLVQVPPGVPSLNVVVDPAHIFVAPLISVGSGYTVTVAVLIQPVDKL